MEQHNFEGDIENISPSQLEFIKNVIEKEGFKDSKVTFETVGGAGDNYAASVKRIVVEGENGNLSIIAKIAPTNEVLRKNLNTPLMFGNEHLIYTEVLPKLLSLQVKAEIPEKDQLKFPKCYGTNVEAPNEVILLEDLKESGFGMLDKFTSLTDECVTSVLKNLAIYHSLSYVLRNKEPETYNYYKDNLQDMWGSLADGTPEELARYKVIESMSINLLDDPEHQKVMKNKVSEVPIRAVKMTKFENGSRFAVIQHGDCWTNNIMFKFEEESLKQSILIDYQVSKNSSPVNDVLYLIFNCTDHETRVRNYYDWVDYYHDELEESLSNYGLKVNYVFPRDQFDADLKRYGKLVFGKSVLLAIVLTMNPEEAGKFMEALASQNIDGLLDTIEQSESETKSIVKKRLTGLIESFQLFGLL